MRNYSIEVRNTLTLALSHRGRGYRTARPDTVEAIEYFYEQGLTDGLPVIPPTAETVGAFLEAGGTEPGEVIGTRASRNWVVTAQKVAVNAIMAGCKAEYAPVVLASIRALLKPEFNASAIAETAGTSAPLIVVNGPIRKELDVNGGWNLFGPGWRANATIGRTLRLVLMNVCREIPGVTDKSTFGHPGRYTFCIAENEEASPWEPYHVEHGMSLQSSAVGLFPALHPMEVFNQSDPSPEAILDTLSHTLAANQVCHGRVMLIMSPEHAQNIGPAGWSKKDVKEYLAKRANEFQPHFAYDRQRARALGGDWHPSSDNPDDAIIPATSEGITLLVAGGEGGGHSTVIPLWGQGISVLEPVSTA